MASAGSARRAFWRRLVLARCAVRCAPVRRGAATEALDRPGDVLWEQLKKTTWTWFVQKKDYQRLRFLQVEIIDLFVLNDAREYVRWLNNVKYHIYIYIDTCERSTYQGKEWELLWDLMNKIQCPLMFQKCFGRTGGASSI